MNVTINIYGDVHIHCDCCDGCSVYDDNFDDALEAPHEAAPDAEDGGEQTGPTAEEAEAAVKALAAFFLPLFSEETDEEGEDGGKNGPGDFEEQIAAHLHGRALEREAVGVQRDDVHFFAFSVRRNHFKIVVQFEGLQNFFQLFLGAFFLFR